MESTSQARLARRFLQVLARLPFPLRFPTSGHQELAKVLWNCRLRWIATASFLILTAPAYHFGLLNRDTAPIFLGIIAGIGVFNLVTQLLVGQQRLSHLPRLVFLQLTFDLFSLCGLLAISGGWRNPFVRLMLMNVSLGAVLLSGGWSVAFLFLAHGLALILQIYTAPYVSDAEFPNFVILSVMFHGFLLVFWIVLRSLGAYLDRTQISRTALLVAAEKQDRLRAIGALAAGFSHEFSSPLNTAKLLLERMARENPSEDLDAALRAIDDCTLVVREMNTSQFDPSSFRISHVNVAALLGDILDSWEEVRGGWKLDRAIEDVGNSHLSPVNFSQVVLNLLDNSVQAGARSLMIQLGRAQGQIIFTLRDDGPGFPPSVLGSLGEPFITTKADGTGLGLYVSSLFVESLGGRLKASNQAEGGALVSLRWPEER